MNNLSQRDLLRKLPVAINNLADPFILPESTENKMEKLILDGHTGPVSLITKGDLSRKWWKKRLKRWAENLNLFVFASISELPNHIEPAPKEARYKTLRAARDAGAFAIAYVRPIINEINSSQEIIEYMFKKSIESGAHGIVSSGFRGDQNVVDATGIGMIEAPDSQKWSRTLKLTPQATSDFMSSLAKELNVPYHTRTLCMVARLNKDSHSLNPYHMAPNFYECNSCPLKTTCKDGAQFRQPLPGSLDLLKDFGYDVTFKSAGENYKTCEVSRRQDCSLCCTNCQIAPLNFEVPYINIRTKDGELPSWGDMSFSRFITGGILSTDPDIPPGETSNVQLDNDLFDIPDGKTGEGNLYGVNSWLCWSEYVPKNKCLKCSYCFLDMFEDVLPPELDVTVGLSPSSLLDRIKK